jgi:hypothetical protein
MEKIGITEVLIAVAVLFATFLLMRELNLWYWRINRIIEGQEESNRLLTKIAKILEPNIQAEIKEMKPEENLNDPDVFDKLLERVKK